MGDLKTMYGMTIENLDLICFSHLRWNFVYQRPQHLLSRFSKIIRFFYIEEPVFDNGPEHYQVTNTAQNTWIILPHLNQALSEDEIIIRQRKLLTAFLEDMRIEKYIFWYYTPMSLSFSKNFHPELIVYDCMDELSAFKFAPQSLKDNEKELLQKADLVFTGGHSLYEAKKHLHDSIYAFPSSIDKDHFSRARGNDIEPADQSGISSPKIGFYGVIDERLNIELIRDVAAQKPEWNFIIIGPVVKIDPGTLPRFSNIYYLGSKSYQELPSYLSGWQVAMIPFALNESTRFISPTKTPEYLAAGKPVVSTSIQDVVHDYGDTGFVHIADTPEDFITAVNSELAITERSSWLPEVDAFLQSNSWDITWNKMVQLMNQKLSDKAQDKKNHNLNSKENIYV